MGGYGEIKVDVGVPQVDVGYPKWTWGSHGWTWDVQSGHGGPTGGHRIPGADAGPPGPLLPAVTSTRSITTRTFIPEGQELWGDSEGVALTLGGPW